MSFRDLSYDGHGCHVPRNLSTVTCVQTLPTIMKMLNKFILLMNKYLKKVQSHAEHVKIYDMIYILFSILGGTFKNKAYQRVFIEQTNCFTLSVFL